MGIIDISVLNATIILILVTCMVSSFVTEHASRQLIVLEKPSDQITEKKERILVPISNPDTIDLLLEFANYLKSDHSHDPIYTLMVVKDENEVATSKALMHRALEVGTEADFKVETATRVDINITAGIIRASKELLITDIVMGWRGNFSPKQWIFGTMLENLLSEIRQPIYVVGFKQPLSTLNQIYALIPPFAEYETGFHHWLKALKNLTAQTNSRLKFLVEKSSHEHFIYAIERSKIKINYQIEELSSWDDFYKPTLEIPENTLLFLLSARKGSISYSQKLDSIPSNISKQFRNKSFVIAYPSQVRLTSVDLRSFLTGSGQLAVDENKTILSSKPDAKKNY